MRRTRWVWIAVSVGSTSACTGIVGVTDVPNPVEGGTDGSKGHDGGASADAREDRGSDATARKDAESDARTRDSGDAMARKDAESDARTRDSGGDATATKDAASDGETNDSGAGCDIAGQQYASDEADPDNACQTCQPSVSVSSWSDVTDGTDCGSDGICRTGACVSGCEIGGVYYMASASDPNNSCQTCQPGTSRSAWSNVADGTECGNGQVCSAGQCGTQCDIAGKIVATGTVDPSNACQLCEPGMSTTAWTTAALGSKCGTGEVCNGTSCVSGCFAGGTVYPSGTANPGNACQSCQPTASATAFSSVEDGTSCTAGTCCSGACVDEATDLNNCGACGNACTAGPSPTCSMGQFCEYTTPD